MEVVRQCNDCCDRIGLCSFIFADTFWKKFGNFMTSDYCCCGYGGNMAMTIFAFIFILSFVKDIISLVTASSNSCNSGMVMEFDASVWIINASVINLCAFSFVLCWTCNVMLDDKFLAEGGCVLCGPIWMGCGGCLKIIWLVIGWWVYSVMLQDSKENAHCSAMMLTWNIL